MKQGDGTWLNQLTTQSSVSDNDAHFLIWTDANNKISDERKPSDYDPRMRPWFKKAMDAPGASPVWTDIYRFYDDGEPGVTAALQVQGANDGHHLIIALDLRLLDMAHSLSHIKLGEQGLAILLSDSGQVLGITRHPLLNTLNQSGGRILGPAAGLDQPPLNIGVNRWLERGDQVMQDSHFLHHRDVWHLGFRPLSLGNHKLWLGVYLPISELIPGLGYQLAALAIVLVLAIGVVIVLTIRLTRSLSRPLEQVAANSLRIGDLDFEPPVPTESDLHEIRQLTAARVVQHELVQHNIEFEEYLNDLPTIDIDCDKLRQVFINLFMNAIQAMGNTGRLTVSSQTRELSLDNGRDRDRDRDRDRSGLFRVGETAIWLKVRDTGPGIEAAQLERIFDPFFTTKAVGEGTGLGLSVSRSIVELHRGSIDLRNHPRGGTSAVLLFKVQIGGPDEKKDPGARLAR